MRYSVSKVSIVIPTKNEAFGLRKIIRSVKPYAKEIIVVDGHSIDQTQGIAKSEGAVYILDNGVGRGDAVRLGIKKATGEIIVFFDADGSHEAKDIPKIIKPVLENKADVVIGSRRTGGSFDLNMNFTGILRSGGSDFLVYLVNKRFNTKLSDILYSFRAIKTSTAKELDLRSNGFEVEQEMVVKSLKKGIALMELPSREKARAWGYSKLKTITGIKLAFNLVRQLYF